MAHLLRRALYRAHNWLVGAVLIAVVLVGCRLWPHPALYTFKPLSVAVYDDQHRLLRLALAKDDRYRLWAPLDQMSPQLVDAVLLHEDRWFRWHLGFNPYGLARGAWVTYIRGGSPQGGSTITMQLARALWQLNTRTPAGKLKQIARALQLELFYSKRQILEAYLNDAPYGRNVEGAGTASLVYFDKPARALTLPEALALAVLPQNPARRLHSAPTDDLMNASLRASRNQLYAQWVRSHPEDAAFKPLFALPFVMRPLADLPFRAPHAVDQVLAMRRALGERTDGRDTRIVTTLDLDLQTVLERQIHQYVARNQVQGMRNAAAILVDTRDMSVKALVGSAHFFDRSISGQVNGTLARRSPGSTLKPFIYALGFDQGVLHPQTVLRDVPTSFGPYAPENFDGHFLGPITATDALNQSRNVPAVWVASQLHQPDLYQFLKQADIGLTGSAQHYGLALVLGGGEVTMQELAKLYAMLANRGVLKPLRLRADDPQVQGTRLLSAEASFMVMDILRQHRRPDEAGGALSQRLPVYWKTGTSWAFRDGWTAGVFGPYVLIVWTGNFDNGGNAPFIGIKTAAPLFFQMVDSIEARQPQLAQPVWPMPPNVKRVQICVASGDLPNQWCPQKGWTWFIPGKSPIRVSTVHRPVVIDDATGRVACPPYAGKHTHQEIYEFWPSDLQRVFEQAGIPRRKPPQNHSCVNMDAVAGDPPAITSPIRGSLYAMRLAQTAQTTQTTAPMPPTTPTNSTRIALNATADASVHTLYWFVDEAYVGHTTPGEPLFWQPAMVGHYTVRVVDDHGRHDERPVMVSWVQ